jgi:hypothetical protein
MANHLKGEVEFEVGEKKLTFRLGVNEMLEIQGDFGLVDKDEEFAQALGDLRGFKCPRIVIFRGLLAHQPEITIERAGEIMTEIGMPRCEKLIEEAVRWALPEKAPADPSKDGEPPRPSPGPTSS